LSDEELDWIAKYRAALDSGTGKGSTGGKINAAIRRVWRLLGFGISSRAVGSSALPLPSSRKLSKSEGSPVEKSNTKVS